MRVGKSGKIVEINSKPNKAFWGGDIIWDRLAFAGDTFRKYADALMRQCLKKGVPPLFVMMRSLYKDAEKVSSLIPNISQFHEVF